MRVSPWRGLPSLRRSPLLPFLVAIPSSIAAAVEDQTVANGGTCDFGTNVCVSIVLAQFLSYSRIVHRGRCRLRRRRTYSTNYHSLVYVLKKASAETLITKKKWTGEWNMCADVLKRQRPRWTIQEYNKKWAWTIDTHIHSCRSRKFLCSLLSGLPQLKRSMTGWPPKSEATEEQRIEGIPVNG